MQNVTRDILQSDLNVLAINNEFILFSSYLVFFMQAGFAFLEAGSIRANNTKAILAKNLIDLIIGSFSWVVFGHAIAYGTSFNGIVGTDEFGAFSYSSAPASFYFEICFCCTAATILSGAVAERVRIKYYCAMCFVLSAMIYPLVVHWVWNKQGFLNQLGFLDFAGSAAIHTVGGICGLVATIMMGPRIGRFDSNGNVNAIPGHNIAYQALGVWILFLGWFGFNPGSAGIIAGGDDPLAHDLPAIVAINTMVGGIAAAGFGFLIDNFVFGKINITSTLNCVLCGLVGVTGIANACSAPSAIVIGAISAIIYHCVAPLLPNRFGIDDPLDVFAVHGANGIWGTLAIGLFHQTDGLFFSGSPTLLWVQIGGILVIVVWCVILSISTTFLFRLTAGELRVSPAIEARGLDAELAGKAAYSFLDESAIHIQEVVESKTLLPIFENFCVLRSCEENLMFYIDVLEFRQINKKKHLKAKAREIYQKYFSPSCEMEVNVPSWAKEHITLQRNAPRYDLFDEAILEIESDLQTLVERCAATSERFADALDANELAEAHKPFLYKLSEGFCCSRPREAGVKNADVENAANADIEKLMEASRLQQELSFKVLILGCGEAGKSTILNQIDLMFNPSASRLKIPMLINGLRTNVIASIQHLINVMEEKYELKFKDPDLVMSRNHVIGMDCSGDHVHYDRDDAGHIASLWDSLKIKEVYEKRTEFWMLESTNYYMENCVRFADTDTEKFAPTELDLLNVRVKTTGVHEYDFYQTLSSASEKYQGVLNANAVDIIWKIVDVGGQQSERRKWMSQFSNVDSSIFVINLCGYQSVMFENPDKLRMHDSLNVLKSIYGSPTAGLNAKPLTVIFNKVDMYHETFNAENFLKCFDDYPKEDLNSVHALTYIKAAVKQLVTSNANVQYLTMNAISTDEVLTCLKAVQCHTFVDREESFRMALKDPKLLDMLDDSDTASVSSRGTRTSFRDNNSHISRNSSNGKSMRGATLMDSNGVEGKVKSRRARITHKFNVKNPILSLADLPNDADLNSIV